MYKLNTKQKNYVKQIFAEILCQYFILSSIMQILSFDLLQLSTSSSNTQIPFN